MGGMAAVMASHSERRAAQTHGCTQLGRWQQGGGGSWREGRGVALLQDKGEKGAGEGRRVGGLVDAGVSWFHRAVLPPALRSVAPTRWVVPPSQAYVMGGAGGRV
jgi:hypothetical protein